MRGVVVEAVAGEEEVQYHVGAEVALRVVIEERRDPTEGRGIGLLVTEALQPRQVVLGGVASGIEREIDDDFPVVALGAQRVVGQLANVGEDHLDLALSAAPQTRVTEEEVLLDWQAELSEQQEPQGALAIAGIVLDARLLDDSPGIHPAELNPYLLIARLV